MDTGAALLRAVCERPDQDTPRGAYADFLDDHADGYPDPGAARGRAEFIRLQLDLAGRGFPEALSLRTAFLTGVADIPPAPGSPSPEAERACELLRRYTARWLGVLYTALPVREVRLWGWSRGFVEFLFLPAADWQAHATTLLAEHPVRWVSLSTPPEFARLAVILQQAQEHGITFHLPAAADADVGRLADELGVDERTVRRRLAAARPYDG